MYVFFHCVGFIKRVNTYDFYRFIFILFDEAVSSGRLPAYKAGILYKKNLSKRLSPSIQIKTNRCHHLNTISRQVPLLRRVIVIFVL
jgi:hypothetical protein